MLESTAEFDEHLLLRYSAGFLTPNDESCFKTWWIHKNYNITEISQDMIFQIIQSIKDLVDKFTLFRKN